MNFLRVAEQIRACDLVMNANLGTAQAAEIFLCLIGASAVEAISLLMVDAATALDAALRAR
jgi:hypothetical protein